jgi:tetratricopeptide (TPR) repeat protein
MVGVSLDVAIAFESVASSSVSPRARIWTIVAALCAVAVAATLGLVAVTRDEPATAVGDPPPLFLDLGVRDDAPARDLRRASSLYADGRLDDARAIFDRYRSPEARIGAAFASWPDTMPALEALPQSSSALRLHEGIVLAATGAERAARTELEAAARLEPDTPYAVRADDFLHPRFAPGLPLFVPSAPFPAALANRSPSEQIVLLAHLRTKSARLHYGSALQRLGMPLSARRVFDDAVRLAPDDPEPLTAAALSRFDKDEPVAAFSRLGPLAGRFPRAQTVRFHLGLLLVWIGDAAGAKRQLRQAQALGPETRLGREAKRFLDRL